MTHELVHMALTSLPGENHWFEEGLATYVGPLARAQDGQLSVEEVWNEMLDSMGKGEPAAGDRGLDQTHTWGRTYWGGALFSLVADIEIRKATANHKSLQDALRAIVAAGATIDTERPLIEVLRIADQATGTTVLENLYAVWKAKPVTVDLDHIWAELGVQKGPHGITFDDNAPLANVRRSMTQPSRANGTNH
jgi:predicted metalloprotease with PDZ domain